MKCPLCKMWVVRELGPGHCQCPADEHVHLLLEWQATAEHRADKLHEARRLLDLRERQLADCTRAMRDAAESIHGLASRTATFTNEQFFERLYCIHDMLYAVRAGKGEK